MADTVDIIEKLIQLALKNPNREEAASAALKAVALLDKYQIPIGSNVTILREAPEWKPDPDFMHTVDEILKGRQWKTDTDANPVPPASSEPGLPMVQSHDVVDGREAFRQRMIDAWRAIREERIKLTAEVYRYEQETHRTYHGDGIRR